MADDLTRPYIGYRSAGRRPERQQDRRAAADAPLAALRGMISGVAGAPGDIESLVRMLPGLSEQTLLPTSEDIERRLPLRSVSDTPAGRAFTTAGQLGGGFYAGPGSPLRAIAALPSAVSRAGRDFAMAAGQPAVNVVKPKGGNWLAGSIEREIAPMRQPVRPPEYLQRIADDEARGLTQPGMLESVLEQNSKAEAMNRWLETKLAKYIKNEMGTAEDPIRALAEKGPIHADILPTGYNVARARREAGFPEEGMGVSPLAKTWEDRADTFINPLKASDMTSGYYPQAVEANPWLLKVPPETPVYEMLQGSAGQGMLGFGHLVDELRNAINPASGLPENLRWKYQDLEKVTVPQAVQRVADINAWRAAQKVEADMARAMGPATHVFKEYPEQGFKWVELKAPSEGAVSQYAAEDLPHGVYRLPGGAITSSPERAMLEDALKYEGETMGHCVGGYCPDVIEGRSRIFSLRDKKGQPHVTVETRPVGRGVLSGELIEELKPGAFDEYLGQIGRDDGITDLHTWFRTAYPELANQERIVQIKGKANRAPNPEYLPAVQDFVRSGKWHSVGDLENAGLYTRKSSADLARKLGAEYTPELASKIEKLDPTQYLTIDEIRSLIKPPEGFAEGGLVGSNIYNSDAMQNPREAYRFADGGNAGDVYQYAEGGAVGNFPTDDFDPARIDSIVGDLHALNAG